MKVRKEDKGFVIWWIDRQFNSQQAFPSKCKSELTGEMVTPQHVYAYKEWRKLPLKKAKIQGWIDDWMNGEDLARLQQAMKEHREEAS